jgi:hypothetical protein
MKNAFLLLLLVPFLACDDDPSFQRHYQPSFVSGHVKYGSGTAAAGVSVVLLRGDWDGGIPPGTTWTFVAATCTNSKGYFSFNFDHQDYVDYMVEVVETSYPYISPTNQLIPAGETKNVQFGLAFEATDSLATLCP